MTPHFRVLALSATPGNDLPCVQNLINNLLIARIELRTDEDPDVRPYTHGKSIEQVVVPANDELRRLRGVYARMQQVPPSSNTHTRTHTHAHTHTHTHTHTWVSHSPISRTSGRFAAEETECALPGFYV